jgi:hypothetical protein
MEHIPRYSFIRLLPFTFLSFARYIYHHHSCHSFAVDLTHFPHAIHIKTLMFSLSSPPLWSAATSVSFTRCFVTSSQCIYVHFAPVVFVLVSSAAIEFLFYKLALSVHLVETRTIDVTCYLYMDFRTDHTFSGQEFLARLASHWQTTQHLGSEELPHSFVAVATILQDDLQEWLRGIYLEICKYIHSARSGSCRTRTYFPCSREC